MVSTCRNLLPQVPTKCRSHNSPLRYYALIYVSMIWPHLMSFAIQDPFDHIEKEFKSDLTQLQKSELDKILRIFDIDDLLGILYEITESRLRFCSHEELILP